MLPIKKTEREWLVKYGKDTYENYRNALPKDKNEAINLALNDCDTEFINQKRKKICRKQVLKSALKDERPYPLLD